MATRTMKHKRNNTYLLDEGTSVRSKKKPFKFNIGKSHPSSLQNSLKKSLVKSYEKKPSISSKKDCIYLDNFEYNNPNDLEELCIALENESEDHYSYQFTHPIDKDFEPLKHLSPLENNRNLIQHNLFTRKLKHERFCSYKIRFSTHYSFDYTIGYLETYFEPSDSSCVMVSRLYIFKLYRSKAYVKKLVESIFKELFIRVYQASTLKVLTFDTDMYKRYLMDYGFKYSNTLPSRKGEEARHVYKIDRKDIRRDKHSDDKFVQDILKYMKKRTIQKNYVKGAAKKDILNKYNLVRNVNNTLGDAKISITSSPNPKHRKYLSSHPVSMNRVDSTSISSSQTHDSIRKTQNIEAMKVTRQESILSIMKNSAKRDTLNANLTKRHKQLTRETHFSKSSNFSGNSILSKDYNYYEAKKRMEMFKANQSNIQKHKSLERLPYKNYSDFPKEPSSFSHFRSKNLAYKLARRVSEGYNEPREVPKPTSNFPDLLSSNSYEDTSLSHQSLNGSFHERFSSTNMKKKGLRYDNSTDIGGKQGRDQKNSLLREYWNCK
ncbi:unnamed protein product [Moneuplotes crassus]|uniref:Uncharacterized protein n=1 Tax=Euplotes crassus TaxID=5936 RepID=A0AAD1UBD7_EUPCR|nr:unnamed protein product [Moneuplotes crassus]